MVPLAVLILVLICSYLVGAIPFGYLIAKARGINILQQGSGNIGATNVGRILGRKLGVLVFLLDFLKGALPAAVGTWLDKSGDFDLPASMLGVGTGLAAIV